MSSKVHLEFLKLKSTEAIKSAAELERVVSAVCEIRKSRVQFKSAWGLSQIILSILCQSCKAAPYHHPDIDLLSLLDLGLRMCPVGTAPRLAATVQDSSCCGEEIALSDLSALASAIVYDLDKQNEESDTAKRIVFNFLLTWEYMLKQRKVDVPTFLRCVTVVGVCLGELHASQLPGNEKEEECIKKLCSQWLTHLVAYGFIAFRHAKAVVSFIANDFLVSKSVMSEDAAADLRVPLQNSLKDPAAPRHWASLLHCFLDGAYKNFRECTKEKLEIEPAIGEGKLDTIKDQLTQMVSQEPPVLSEQFDAPLGMVSGETIARTLDHFCKTFGRQEPALVELLDHVLLALDLSDVISVLSVQTEYIHCFRSAPLYNYIHATVSLALREGHVETALVLLEKTVGSSGSAHLLWSSRLRRWVQKVPLQDPEAKWLDEIDPLCPIAAPAPLFSVFARDAAQRLNIESALDIVVGPSRVELLRLVCHTILHEPTCDWVPQLLRHPYVPFFIHEALARLTTHLIEETDLPLARHYLSSLILCVAQNATRCGVQQVMRVTHEFAVALRGTCSLKTAAFWRQVEAYFSTEREKVETAHKREGRALGRAFDARESFFRFFHDNLSRGSTDLRYAKPYTLVQLCVLDTGRILIQRTRCNDCFSTLERCVEIPIASVSDFSQALESIQTIAQTNKRQLSAGADASSATNALTERNATQLNESSPQDDGVSSKRTEKEKWWRRRFDLDMELRHEVQQLELSLGVSRLLLLGELDLPLQLQLQAISDRLSSGIVDRLESERMIGSPSSVNPEKLSSFIFLVLQGLPYLYHTPREGDVKVSSRIRYARKVLLYSPHHHATCTSCRETKRSLTSLLRLYVENFIGEKAYEPMHPLTASDEITHACSLYDDAVLACLEGFYTSLGSVDGEPLEEHKNLRLYPRQHVYLAIDSVLQAMPWETLEVTKGQHISRVPSKAYLAAVAQQGEVSRALDRVFLYGDTHHEATKMERFEPLLQAHPQWCSSTDPPPESSTTGDSLFLAKLLGDAINLYVFAGHKKGEQLISRAHLYDRFPAPPSSFPSVLLMGCGSATTRGGPGCDSYGMPYAYLHAGAPAFVGCLWDITDGEIDKLTCRLLSSLEERGSLVEALASARGVCKLPHLSAAATVLYGADVKFE